MKRLIRGALAGTLATGFMSAAMLGAKRAGFVGGMPPEKVTAKLLNRAGIRRNRRQQDILATALHFGFGAAAGSAFGLLAPRSRVARIPLGMAYGTAIWGVSYLGWVPAMAIMPPADRDRTDRQVVMLAGHLVYGTALAFLVGGRANVELEDAPRSARPAFPGTTNKETLDDADDSGANAATAAGA